LSHSPGSVGSLGTEIRSIENAAINSTEKIIPAIAAARGVFNFARIDRSFGIEWLQNSHQQSCSVTCTTPGLRFVLDFSPLFSNTFSIGRFSGKTSAVNSLSPASRPSTAR
jgi:hypothetical protein